MAVKGIFSSDASMPGDRKGDFSNTILKHYPTGTAQLFALTSGMGEKPATDTIVNWFEEGRNPGRAEVVGNVGNPNGPALDVLDSSWITNGMIFMVESTGEYLFVVGVTGNQIQVTRAFGNTAGAPINGTPGAPVYIQRIGNAFEEGSERPVEVANIGYPRFNYCQIFRNTWGVTGTATAVDYMTGSKTAENKSDCAMYHAEDIERSLIWGRKVMGTRNGQPFRTMDGVTTQIQTNRFTSPAAGMTRQLIDDYIRVIFERNVKGLPNERISFCGNQVISVINRIVWDNSHYDIKAGENEYGIKVTRWITPYGELKLLTHPLMNENPMWQQDWYVLHPGVMRMRWLRKTHTDNDDKSGSRQGRDADVGVLTSELSCEYKAEITGAVYTGIRDVDLNP